MRQFMRQLIPSMFHRRLVMLATLALFVLAAMLAQLAHLTVVRSEALRERAESLLVTREFVPSRRGEIVDRHGRTLARDRLSYHVNVHYSLISGRWAYRQAERHAMREHRRRWPELSRRERDRLAERYRPQYERVVRQFWEDLAMATGTPLAEIESHKNDVLLRVAQIRGSVIARRMQREREQYEMPVSSANVAQPIGEEVMGHPVVFDIDRDVRRSIEALIARAEEGEADLVAWQQVEVEPDSRREYPNTSVTLSIDTSSFPTPLRQSEPVEVTVEGVDAHLVGRMRSIWREDRERRPFSRRGEDGEREVDLGGYLPGDMTGLGGIEEALEAQLRGVRGERIIHLDTLEQEPLDPVPGRDVQLTVDVMLQARIQALMDPELGLLTSQPWHGQRDESDERYGADPDPRWVQVGDALNGAAVVLDVASSEVLAAVSQPGYSREQLENDASSIWDDRLNRPDRYRVTHAVYPPGSTVKPLVLAAAATEGAYNLDRTLECTGMLDPDHPNIMRCWIYRQAGSTHGPLKGDEAVARSCNIFFYKLGRALGGPDLVRWYGRFGLGRNAAVGLGDEPGALPRWHPDVSSRDPGFSQSEAIFMGIGQGRVAWTPLQAAASYAAMVEGAYRQPTFVRNGDAFGLERHQWPLDLDPQAVDMALRGLDLGANRRGVGTAVGITMLQGERIFNVPGVTVMAKSGTAQASPTRYDSTGDGRPDAIGRLGSHAWCIALVKPEGADEPRYVVAVVLEHAGSGGSVAGPVVNQVVHALKEEGYL